MKALVTLVISILFLSCSDEEQIEAIPLKIAVSKASGDPVYKNYINWIKDKDSTIIIVDLYQKSIIKAQELIDGCDGLILSGGPDPHPGRYGKGSDTARCDIDLDRDTLEFAIYNYALEKNKPVLGICRGMQVINVAEGGSLIIDIPNDVNEAIENLHQNGLPEDALHKVTITSNSKLKAITKLDSGTINCNHHQGIDKLANGFKASSISEDGLIESIENINNNQWVMAVQWHPERLKVEGLSNPIRDEFLAQIKSSK